MHAEDSGLGFYAYMSEPAEAPPNRMHKVTSVVSSNNWGATAELMLG